MEVATEICTVISVCVLVCGVLLAAVHSDCASVFWMLLLLSLVAALVWPVALAVIVTIAIAARNNRKQSTNIKET